MVGSTDSSQGSSGVRRLQPADDVVGQKLGDEVVLVNLQTNRIFELNHTGARFWDLLQSETDRGRIEQQLGEEYDVAAEDLSDELDELVSQLAEEKLVNILESD
ncbi:MAG: PqqD family protein [Egibacteraceae bacterium]